MRQKRFSVGQSKSRGYYSPYLRPTIMQGPLGSTAVGPAEGFNVPYSTELLSPTGVVQAGGNVMNLETAQYLFNLWLTQYRDSPDGTELILWRYSGANYAAPQFPRFIERRAQLSTSGGTKTWSSLAPQFCSPAYCP